MKLHKVNRPRERMEKTGACALKDEELLAIMLGTGTVGKDVTALAKEILRAYPGKNLCAVSLKELKSRKGIGLAKASLLLAAFELSKRLLYPEEDCSIQTARDVLPHVQEIRSRKKENFVVLYLNARNQMIVKEYVSIGTLNSSLVHPREVFAPAIQHSAASVILCHNHPSGDCQPSPEDLQLTRQLISAGELLGIEVLDHLILSQSGYLSMKEQKII